MKTLSEFRKFSFARSVRGNLIWIIGLLLSLSAGAQSALFTTIPEPTLTSAQTKVKTYALSLPRIGDLEYVQFASGWMDAPNGTFLVSLTGIGENLPFEIREVLFEDSGNYIVSARYDDVSLAIYVAANSVGGVVEFPGGRYSLFPIGGEVAILIRHDLTSSENSGTCGGTTGEIEEIDFCTGDCGDAVLDVLLLITPEAQTWMGATFDIWQAWWLFQESHNINLALVNSGVQGKRVRVTTRAYIPDFNWSNNNFSDLRLQQDLTSVSQSSSAIALSNQNGADITVLLTNNNYTGPVSTFPNPINIFFGIANSLDPLSQNKFCITQVQSIGPIRYTLAHEIAHQFGCEHSNVNHTLDHCSHGMNMANGRNTIMANNAADNTRIANFSNPDILWWDGTPTGVADERDNAQQIRAAFCESADNRALPVMTADIKHSGLICPGEEALFTSSVLSGRCLDPFWGLPVECGVGPYQYTWEMSQVPSFAQSTIVGSGSTLTPEIGHDDCPFFYLRLTVVSADGHTAVRTRRFFCHPRCDEWERTQEYGQVELQDGILSPNPARESCRVPAHNVLDPLQVIVSDVQGRAVRSINWPEQGLLVLEIDLSGIAPGMYFVQVLGKEKRATYKLIKH